MKVVGSLSTIPSRINHLEPTLESLHNQTKSLDKIYLNIPRFCKKEHSGYTIPQFIHKYNVEIVILDQDYGPLCKLIGALIKEHDPNTRIITFDDDLLYPNHTVNYLLQKSLERKCAAISSSGIKIGKFPFYASFAPSFDNPVERWFTFRPDNDGEEVDILCGYPGAIYNRSFFPTIDKLDLLTSHALADTNIYKNDDVLISAWLAASGVSSYIYPGIEIFRRDVSYYGGLSSEMKEFVKSVIWAVQKCEDRGLEFKRIPIKWNKSAVGPFILLFVVLLIIVFLVLIVIT